MQPIDVTRCLWAEQSEIERRYHDDEWGVPLFDDTRLFRLLILEGAQAGLSWRTILEKRAGYDDAFAGFSMAKVAAYGQEDVQRLLTDARIVRNRAKINAAIANARAALEIVGKYGSLAGYLWKFVNGRPIQNAWTEHSQIPALTPEAQAMSKDLKKRGFSFVGPTICYAFMQSSGMVNDHLTSCFRYSPILELGRFLQPVVCL